MPDESLGEKTEDPTPKRRQEARDEGNLAKSQDLTAGVSLLLAVLLLAVFATPMLSSMKVLMRSMLMGATVSDAGRTDDLAHTAAVAMQLGARMLAPIALGVMVAGVLAGILQVGFIVSHKPIVPKMSKVNPGKGLKNIFSMRGLVRFLMSIAKVAVVLIVAGVSIHLDLPKLMTLIRLEAGPLLAAAGGLAFSLSLKIAIVLLLLGILDYAFQKWQHEQDLKMSKQEVKEEHKRMEGDPLIKQRRSQTARQVAMQRLNHDVPQADVVVTNPTHFAVALRYDGEKMEAPKVAAKGADYMAMRIRQLAIAHDVPIVERPPLARALYRGVEVGQEIPPQHYAAVAEILAYVYRLSGQKTA